GTYYVVVEGYNGNFDINRCYTLKAEATAIAPCIVNYEPNDYFAKATAINTNTNYYAGIGSSTDKDFYKFTLNSKSIVTVTLQNLPKNYDLIIYNIAQGQIGKSALGGTSNESITINYLDPGTYYVVVEGYNGNFDINRCYTLKAEATAIAPCIVNYEPNDYFAKATAINTNTNYYAGIGSSTDKDFYKFTLNSKSIVTVTLQNLPKNYDLIIYNIAQGQIGKSALGGTSNESITINYLDPGTYYVVVEGYNGNFDINRCYTLKAEATAIAPCIVNYEPNDSFAKATDINTNTNYYAGIGSSADKDYYKFTLNSKSNVTVTLQNLPKNYDLIIYNIAQNQIGKSALGGTSNESITLNYLKPGTYYVVVEGYNGNFDINRCYNLKIQTTNAININKDVNIATYELLNTENNTSVILYPNPVEDIINIKGIYSEKKEHTTLTIFDRNGSIVKSFLTKVENVISINVSDLSPNVYYLSIKGKNYKFIKK
ncbi:pre-peptidase C-terminal domain-containing protein, partial [Apibacter adventoris]